MKYRKLRIMLIIAVLCAFMLPVSALAADIEPGSDAKGLVLLYGADADGNNVSGNYWNGFVVEDPDGQQYVIAGSGSYLDFVGGGEGITATAFTDEGTQAISATVYDISAGVALYKVEGSIPGASALHLADSTHIEIGGTAKVVGFDWTKLSGAETAVMHSAYATKVTGSDDGDKYTFYTIETAAPDSSWESAAVINDDGYVVGILISGDMDSFFPMDVIIRSLGYDDDADVTKDLKKDEDGNGGGVVVILLVVVILGILAYGYMRYRKNVAAGYTPDRRKKKRDDDEDIPLAMNYQPGERLCIIGISGYYAGQKFRINGEVTIGRSTARCNLVFPDSTRGMSNVHCMIRQRGSQLEVKDLGSTQGTFCRGLQVAPNTSVLLSPGERFYLGSPQNTFEVSL